MRTRSLWLVPCLGLALTGCGKSDGLPKLTVYPVEGRIETADGKPLKGGRIYFVPKDGAVTAEGEVSDDGKFTLITGGSGPGAPPGDYKVRIEPADASLLATKKSPTAGKKLPFPQKFLDEDSSGLTAVVKSEPNKLEPFRLK